MIVTLICEKEIYSVLLPEKIRGQFWIEDQNKEITDKKRKLLGIEAENEGWKIKESRKYKLYELATNQIISRLILEENQMYIIEFLGGVRGYLFTEANTRDRCTFRKYQLSSNAVVNIGRNADNQITIDNKFVSNVHAQLSLANDVWVIADNHSKNGVYINGKRLVQNAVLAPGDVIYIMGLKIVLGNHFLALNNPDGRISVQESILRPYIRAELQDYEEPEEIEDTIYYRSPRFDREIKTLKLKIDAPTNPEIRNDTSMVLTLAPTMVMGIASLSSGIVTMVNVLNNDGNIISSIPTMFMSVSMLLSMVFFPFITKKQDKKRKDEKEKERCEKYLKYLVNIRNEIKKESDIQREILGETFPMVLKQFKQQNFFELLLWSRVIGQKNFLTFRIGLGNIPLKAEISFPDQRFSIDDDLMKEEMKKFGKEKRVLEEVPVTCSLSEHRVAGIVGKRKVVNSILHNILMQTAALHSYDEVKIVFICDERDFSQYGYVRWMQHIWDNNFRVRYLATTPEEVRDLSSNFTRIIGDYQKKESVCPHYVVISTSKALAEGCAFLEEFLRDETIKGISYLAVYDELKNLPKECTAVIQANEAQGILFDYKAVNREQIVFIPDMVKMEEVRQSVMEIAEYRLDLLKGKYTLPEMLTFLDMFHVGKYEHLNIASRWKENNPVLSLQTPVGVNTDGDLFYLDLHEREHGPHGLIAGMTGSGKSEFIITYILSLAVNYSPNDIALILIDYKGGGLVGAFDNEQYRLPHLAGTITNLDGASINRSLLSIQSELRRRQAVFNEARSIANEGTMDIYKYQKLFRNGTVKGPMPHLLIVSDEFAELKAQQPEFMAQLISTARIGRSLGVHLILATQKPSGVVNEQIWANSKFKICLKVQDRADSMDMLKRPDAAELIEQGRFYLQVGYNELFELGQSAWCGAPYISADAIENEIDTRLQLINHRGEVVDEARPKKKTMNTSQMRKQIVEIAQYITQIAKEEKIQAEQLWLPEIPKHIALEELERKYNYQSYDSLNPIIGELDDPYNQDQRLLTLPISEKGNAICYGAAGSGKENFLTTVLYSLYMHHSSETLNVYILDFGSETLGSFWEAPQTGDFIVSGEEEKIINLFRYLDREIAERKKKIATAGGNYNAYCKSGKKDAPNIVIVINDYIGFSEQYEEISDRMPSFTRDCTKYGIYFLITCTSPMGIRYKLQQNFNQFFVLQMNDKTDYVSILGNTGGVYPSRISGRGIYREKDVYEFQTASVSKQSEKIQDEVKRFSGILKEKEGDKKAKPVMVMPKTIFAERFDSEEISFASLPIGIKYNTLETTRINLRKRGLMQVLAMDRQETVPFTEGICNVLKRAKDCEVYILDSGGEAVMEESENFHYVREQIEETVVKLFWLTVERHNDYKKTDGKFSKTTDLHPVVVVIAGLMRIKEILSTDGVDKLRLILEKTSGKYNQFFWLIDDYASANRYSTEAWCKGEGIWVGNGVMDQIRFKVNGGNRNFRKVIDFSVGFIIRKGKAEQIKLVTSELAEEEEYG